MSAPASSSSKKFFSSQASVNPASPHFPSHKSHTPSSTQPHQTSTTEEPLQQTIAPPPPPWLKIKSADMPIDQSQDRGNLKVRGGSDLAGDIPTHGHIVTMSQPGHYRFPMVIFVSLILLVSPFIGLTWASYKNWPAYLHMPTLVTYSVDSILAKTPLPLTPSQLTRVVIGKVLSYSSTSHQIIITSDQSSSENQIGLTISGKSNRQGQGEWLIAGRFQANGQNIPINAQIISNNEAYFLKVSQTEAIPELDFSSVNNQWIKIPRTENTNSSYRVTPGQQALGKIRATKLTHTFENFYQQLLSQSELITNDETVPDSHYLIRSSINQAQIIELFTELVSIYQETQTYHNFDPAKIQQWYLHIEKYVAEPIVIATLINKNSLMPEIINITSHLDPQYSSNTSQAALAELDRNNRSYATEINYTPTFGNETFHIDEPSEFIEHHLVDWRTAVRYPILEPIIDYFANTSVNNL